MPLVPLFVAAFLLLALAAYAQLQIPRFTSRSGNAILSRAALAITGTGLGFVAAMVYPGDPSRALLAFLIGFGIVHFPAAAILFVKRARHSGRS
jgi:hypothetical protein